MLIFDSRKPKTIVYNFKLSLDSLTKLSNPVQKKLDSFWKITFNELHDLRKIKLTSFDKWNEENEIAQYPLGKRNQRIKKRKILS